MKLKIKSSTFTKVEDITIPEIFYRRLKCGIREFDTMFGNGLLPGSSLTFTGQAGSGKTTALLQYMEALAGNGYNVGYASGEENKYQLAFTCKRLNVKNVQVANETDIDTLAASMENFDVLVVDSFQALTTTKKLNSAALERYAVSTLIAKAKECECSLIFVLHLTKAGKLKGSTLVPHSVDVNFQIMMDADGEATDRVISVYKNRFGTTGDYGASMGHSGLILSGKKEVVRAQSKATRKKELHKKVLAMDPPHITKENVMQKCKLTAGQAYIVLKELTDNKELVKFGRGKQAVYKKANVSTYDLQSISQ